MSGTTNEGIFQTITIPDASQPLQWTYDYTEYTRPGQARCQPRIEFRVNGNDDSNGTSISQAPSIGEPGGPPAEGSWVSLTTDAFTPADFGITDGGSMDVYVGVIANGCRETWGYVDSLAVVVATDADLETDVTLASGDSTPEVGDTVTFEVTVTNNGPIDATGVSLTDALPSGLIPTANNGDVPTGTSYNSISGVWTIGDLEVGESVTLTLEGTVAPGQAGETITNTSSAAVGNQPDPTTAGDDLTEAVTVPTAPEITGVLSATITNDTGPAGLSAGDTVTFSVVAANDGDVVLSNVDVLSTELARADDVVITGFEASNFSPLSSTTLATGESVTFVADHVVTQADIDAGGLVATATVVGTPPSGAGDNVTDITDDGTPGADGPDAGTDPSDDPLVLAVSPAPAIVVTKSATATDQSAAGSPTEWNPGDQITYAVRIENTGNVTISSPSLTGDPLAATVPLTNANTSGEAPSGFPAIDTGNDALEPGEVWTYTYVYDVTQDDIDAGEVLGTATVTGTDPALQPVSDASDGDGNPTADSPADIDALTGNDPVVTPLVQTGLMSLAKTVNDTALNDGIDVGDVLTYTITLENIGNVTLEDVVLTDLFEDGDGNALALDSFAVGGSPVSLTGNLDGSASYALGSDLDVGDTVTFTATYALTSATIASGMVDNLASVLAETPAGASVEVESRVGGNTTGTVGTPTASEFPGAIEGIVLNYLSGAPGITVNLIDESTNTTVDTTLTGSDGRYEFIGIPNGTYTLEFVNPAVGGTEPTALSASYDETENRITGIVVENGTVTVEQNAFLVDPSGVVYDSQSFAPISGAVVTLLFDGAPVPNTWLDTDLGDANGVATDADGQYTFFLDPDTAQDGVYTIDVSRSGYIFESTATPAAAGPFTPGTGGGTQEISSNAVPTSGMDSTYYLSFDFTFTPGNPGATSNGVVRNHIPIDTVLAPTIREDLETILRDDLAAALSQQSRRMEGYAKGALQRLRSRPVNTCAADVNALLANDDIRFDTDRAVIRPESDELLDALAVALASCPAVDFEIGGHTDSRASDAYNLDLSQRRVDAVLAALAARGIDTAGYVARGYGEQRPIASNDTDEGMALNRRVEFVPLSGTEEQSGMCADHSDLSQTSTLNGNDDGVTFEGAFRNEAYSCANDRWTIVEGEASVLRIDDALDQTMVSLSWRRESFVNPNRVQGVFVGLYRSESEVTSLATGEIDGLGLNAGVYGANRTEGDLLLDYYLGAATGRHTYDLSFNRTPENVQADGSYDYIAGFVGAAVSGQTMAGDWHLSPRAGLDYAYSPGGQADVDVASAGLSQSDSFSVGSVSGGRIFGELSFSTEPEGTGLGITPRVACYDEIGSLDGYCSLGGTIDYSGTTDENDVNYGLSLDAERSESVSYVAIAANYSWRVLGGTVTGSADATAEGEVSLSQTFNLDF